MKKVLQTLGVLVVGAAAGAGVALPIAVDHNSSSRRITQENSTIPTVVGASVGDNMLDVSAIYKEDAPGVVNILVKQKTESLIPGENSSTSEDIGAGVVLDKRGDILTDEHVVGAAKTAMVTFADGKNTTAQVLGADASTDVAVIRVHVPSLELHPIALDASDNVAVGDPVVAIGSPFDLPETVTSGIVSQTGRSITAPNGYAIAGAVQTDAAINPGNSGGPLLNASGDVIGLNDQIDTTNTAEGGEGSNSGVGFATPAAAVKKVAHDIIAGKNVQHAYLGVNLSSIGGASVGAAAPSGPAGRAGIQSGDVITRFNGIATPTSESLIAQVALVDPGAKVSVTYIHDGKLHTTTIIMASQPKRQVTTQ